MTRTQTETEAATQTAKPLTIPIQVAAPSQSTDYYIPLRLSGALDHLEQNDLTPGIGTQFENINLTEILHSPCCDQMVRDLAITSEFPPRQPCLEHYFHDQTQTIRHHIHTTARMDGGSYVSMLFILRLTNVQSPSAACVSFLSKSILPSKMKSYLLAS